MWLTTSVGGFVDFDKVVYLVPTQSGGNWLLKAITVNSTDGPLLVGTYASQADATDAAQKLTNGLDTAAFTG